MDGMAAVREVKSLVQCKCSRICQSSSIRCSELKEPYQRKAIEWPKSSPSSTMLDMQRKHCFSLKQRKMAVNHEHEEPVWFAATYQVPSEGLLDDDGGLRLALQAAVARPHLRQLPGGDGGHRGPPAAVCHAVPRLREAPPPLLHRRRPEAEAAASARGIVLLLGPLSSSFLVPASTFLSHLIARPMACAVVRLAAPPAGGGAALHLQGGEGASKREASF